MNVGRVRASVAICAALLSVNARAEGTAQDKAAASQLFDDAERLMTSGHHPEACSKYAESQHLDPQLGTLLHLGECYASVEKTASAWATFRDALEIATSRADPREARIRDRVTELEQRLPKIRVVVAEPAPADLEVRRDGEVLGRAMWGSPIPVDPGAHTLSASASGRSPWSGSVQIASNNATTDATIPELASDASSTTPSSSPNAPPAGKDAATPNGDGSVQRILGWTAAGVGAVGIGVGIAFEVVRGNKLSERDRLCTNDNMCSDTTEAARVASLTSDARTASTVGIASLVAGGVFAAGGLVLVFTAPHDKASPTVAAVPVVSPGLLGATVYARW